MRHVGGWLLAAGFALGVLAGGAQAQGAGRVQAVVAGTPDMALEVWKGKREMWLKQQGRVTRTFRVSLGLDPASTKLHQGDGRTPVGRYYVCEKRPKSRFRRFLGISYPNIDDAERGFADRLIDADQWADILFANFQKGIPPWHTALGGRVGIHGHGGRHLDEKDWTEGCIAISDAEIDYLYDVVSVGTPVIIHD